MDEMTTAELNQYLENIAQLIEERTKDKDRETAEIAIQAVRNSKNQGIKSERPPLKRRSHTPERGEPGALPRPPP